MINVASFFSRWVTYQSEEGEKEEDDDEEEEEEEEKQSFHIHGKKEFGGTILIIMSHGYR